MVRVAYFYQGGESKKTPGDELNLPALGRDFIWFF